MQIFRFLAAMLTSFVWIPENAHAETQVGIISVPTQWSVQRGTNFPVTFSLARPGSTPPTMTVDFYMVLPSNGQRSYLASESYTTPGTKTRVLTNQGNWYGPATGWKIYAVEKTQTSSGPFSYSTAFSMAQDPPLLEFTPVSLVSGGDPVIISRVSSATADATDLSTSDNVTFKLRPKNIGVATAHNCVLRTELDGVVLGDDFLPDLIGTAYIDPPATAPLGNMQAGTHTLRFSFLGGNDSTHRVMQESFFVFYSIDRWRQT